MAKPFLKWAGGKRQLLPEILSRLPENIEEIDIYVEPFVGGGALLFQMIERYNFKEIHIFDINLELINCYRQIQESVDRVIHHHELLISKYPEGGDRRDEFYYNIRNKWNSNLDIESMSSDEKSERVAEMIFLNKTCFNGLFRLNRKGEFNVPTGRYKKPSFTNSEELIKVSKALQGVQIHHASFENCLNVINESSFVYFDPPYRPLSKTSAFVSYSKGDFNDSNQKELANLAEELDNKMVKFLLSNSDPKNTDIDDDFFDELYSNFQIDRVFASRAINSNPDKRGKISELLIKNY
tara:strand:+ start:213 stop:1100 length:888 start_codon:yes stop_codon:yes gene_type:complete